MNLIDTIGYLVILGLCILEILAFTIVGWYYTIVNTIEHYKEKQGGGK